MQIEVGGGSREVQSKYFDPRYRYALRVEKLDTEERLVLSIEVLEPDGSDLIDTFQFLETVKLTSNLVVSVEEALFNSEENILHGVGAYMATVGKFEFDGRDLWFSVGDWYDSTILAQKPGGKLEKFPLVVHEDNE